MSTKTSMAKPALVDGSLWYVALKVHAQSCDDCLGDVALALISLRVCGELVFDLTLCSEGERLLANVSRALQHHELAMSFPLCSDGGSATKQAPRDETGPSSLSIPTPREVTH